ncbi:MAG TPA: glycosyltransferase family 87 protein [Chloroflexota bacterium]|nr:glycosyltransferase family 87 protein [Chloroflexota bacterium]
MGAALGSALEDRSVLAAPAGRLLHWRSICAVGPLLVLLVLWLWLFAAEGAFKGGPNGSSFGADFAMFYTGSHVLASGQNLYDHTVLLQAEARWLAHDRLPIVSHREVVRVGNPPLFFWALGPLAALPFQSAAYIWLAFVYGVSLVGFLSLSRTFGWRRRALPALVFLAMPPVALGAFYGNVVALAFAATALALALERSHPLLAGMLLTLCWLKPPVALPVALLILAFGHERTRLIAGFLAGSALTEFLTVIATGWSSTAAWLHGLGAYSNDIGLSPGIASLSGIYVRDTSGLVRTGISLIILAVAAAATLRVWRSGLPRRAGALTVPSLWIVWFLAAPYAHIFDEILLTAPVMVLIGRDAHLAVTRRGLSLLYAAFLSLAVIQAVIVGVQLLWVPVVWMLLAALPIRPGQMGIDVDRETAVGLSGA